MCIMNSYTVNNGYVGLRLMAKSQDNLWLTEALVEKNVGCVISPCYSAKRDDTVESQGLHFTT